MIRFLANSLRVLATLKNGARPWLKYLSKPAKLLGHFLLLAFILPLYKFYSIAKKILAKLYAPQKIRHRLIHPFSRRYLTHGIIVIITVLTVASNLNAYETRQEEFGQTSVVQTLASAQDEGTIAEEGPVTGSTKITHYLSSNGVSTKPQIGPDEIGIDHGPLTVVGGSAVVKPIISPVKTSTGSRTAIAYYTIESGDTISSIADNFDISINTILWANNLTAYTLLRPGDKLLILPVSGVQHTIAKGDTIAKISKKYSIDADKILDANRLASADAIHVGEALIIPGGKKIITPVAPVYQPQRATTPTRNTQTAVSSSGRMLWPTACRRMSQYYSWRHTGVDIACGMGVAVYASDNGRVIKAQGGYNGGYGLIIIIDHGNGLQSLYGHNSKLYVQVGDVVTRGQTIAAQGSTGRSTGPHTHFEIRSGGARRNPLLYIR